MSGEPISTVCRYFMCDKNQSFHSVSVKGMFRHPICNSGHAHDTLLGNCMLNLPLLLLDHSRLA